MDVRFGHAEYSGKWKHNMRKWLGNEALDLKLALMDSAQCFGWTETSGGFLSVLNDRPICLWREADGIYMDGDADAANMRFYLDLDRDYVAIAAEYSEIPAARRAIELYPGMRVLNQDPWEALISFILSANNNVARIRSLVQAICRDLGREYVYDGQAIYGFPTPQALAACSEARLRKLGVGYRAPYLIGTAQRVCEGFPIERLCEMEYESAHAQLVSLPGVGDKVADCVLLFGCRQAAAFPVDVWVEKLLASWFGIQGSRRKLAAEARRLLGDHAGILQQFLFHAARMGDIEL